MTRSTVERAQEVRRKMIDICALRTACTFEFQQIDDESLEAIGVSRYASSSRPVPERVEGETLHTYRGRRHVAGSCGVARGPVCAQLHRLLGRGRHDVLRLSIKCRRR